jgi:hypothetical protein
LSVASARYQRVCGANFCQKALIIPLELYLLSALSSPLRKTIAESAWIIDQCQRYRFQSASNSYIAAVDATVKTSLEQEIPCMPQ